MTTNNSIINDLENAPIDPPYSEVNRNVPALSKYEIAAVTLGVPCTLDEHLNRIISLGARYKLAAEIVANDPNLRPEYAIQKADDLLDAFRARKG